MPSDVEFPASARRECCWYDITLYVQPPPEMASKIPEKCSDPIEDHLWFLGQMSGMPDRGFFCRRHSQRIHMMPWTHGCHAVGPDCAMPGAMWNLDLNRCVVPDDPFEAMERLDVMLGQINGQKLTPVS